MNAHSRLAIMIIVPQLLLGCDAYWKVMDGLEPRRLRPDIKHNCPSTTSPGPASDDTNDPEYQRTACVCTASDSSWNAQMKICDTNPCPSGSYFDYGGKCCKSDSGCAALAPRHRVRLRAIRQYQELIEHSRDPLIARKRERTMKLTHLFTFQSAAIVAATILAACGSDESSLGLNPRDAGGTAGFGGSDSGAEPDAPGGGGGADAGVGGGGGMGGEAGLGGASGTAAGGAGGSGGAPVCNPGDKQCDGPFPQICDDYGHWKQGTQCPYACAAGECTGNCPPAAKHCDGNIPQICSVLGVWENGSVCPYACQSGACTGECVPDTKHCVGTSTETCAYTGWWWNKQQCPVACENGDCVGECAPGTKACDGTVPKICDASASWAPGTACPFACMGGDCVGTCTPGSKQCVGKTLQVCDSGGQWAVDTTCYHVCLAGACTGVCEPGAKGCDDNTPRSCDSTGQWVPGQPCGGGTPICTNGSCQAPPVGPTVTVLANLYPATFYNIDVREVTRGEYEGWLLTNPPIASQPSHCAWNSSFAADSGCMTGTAVCHGTTCGNHPQVCIDWCDAYAYCSSVGKRLCGRIGGGPLGNADLNSQQKSQWYNACSSGGANSLPYGNSYQAHTCNGAENNVGTTVPVATMNGCQSGVGQYTGVKDLSGNVYEWEDSCNGNTGKWDYCGLRVAATRCRAPSTSRARTRWR